MLRDAPCPFEIEFLEDGTARSNFLGDDSTAARCSVQSVSFGVGRRGPNTLDFFVGPQILRYCVYAFDGPILALSCDEHRPPTSAPWLRFSRPTAVMSSNGPTDVTGTWSGLYLGFPVSMTFTPDGRFSDSSGGGQYHMLGTGSQLELIRDGRAERCGVQFRTPNDTVLSCASLQRAGAPLLLHR